ncbi:ankyrin repeat domain-containing protein [Maribacter sp. 1_MG-2023]|uniref:ankyrin repeat domain-containing protein n=1 Tax=Maribacter sp. 1_MG-2023 TaxID=3062677 RepID=UPI0026E2246B|nr:ankyrin repeat domain-containing protein [Maribacter sp. 1_MG-2023]MDO6473521.1 ankyrin repeat domain-containing protein [Maribacter sp. 1_MG-2023]
MKKSISILLFISVFALTGIYANNSDCFILNEAVSDSVNEEISSLCKAVMKGDIDQVRSLLALGEKLNEKSLGLTPAMYAARYNKAEVLKILLLNGANLSIKSDQGYTAKDYAKMSNAKDVLDVIKQDS